MSVILVALNAKYIHTNLAVRYIKKHCAQCQIPVTIAEYTINHRIDYLLAQLYRQKPDILAFSCYIWNIELVKELGATIKKVLPQVRIVLGGPEVSFGSELFLEKETWADCIMRGEGEQTAPQLFQALLSGKPLNLVEGITYREGEQVISTPDRPCIDMDKLLFPYDDLHELDHQILYYEAARGCPFSCRYCLSSVDKKVRFRSLELVYRDLLCFLEAKVPQVKFVDRTFNANRRYALSIFRFLKEHDNGITNFHFELCADLLDQETLSFLQGVRPGQFQFEIGIQSTNLQTISAIDRTTDLSDVWRKTSALIHGGNCHVHLDLIAGLPYEDYASFARSYNQVYELHPHMLQLGFLKVLKGSGMEMDCEKYGIFHRDKAPYEVLSTNFLSFEDVLQLKDIEELNDRYYNSMRFTHSMEYLVSQYPTPFSFFEHLANFFRSTGLFAVSHSQLAWYEILLQFFQAQFPGQDTKPLLWRIFHDICLHEKPKSIPEWLAPVCEESVKGQLFEFLQSQENRNQFFPEYSQLDYRQIYRGVQAARFPFDILHTGAEPDIEGGYTVVYTYRHTTLSGATTFYLPDVEKT